MSLLNGRSVLAMLAEKIYGDGSAARSLWSRLKHYFSDYKLIPVTFYKDPKGLGGYVTLILSHYFMF